MMNMHDHNKIKRMNLVVVPRMGRSFMNIVVSHRFVYFAMTAGVLVLGANLFLLSGYIGMRGKLTHVRRVEEVSSEVQALAQDAESIRRDLDKVKEINRRIENKTGITAEPGYVDGTLDSEDSALPSRGWSPEVESLRERFRLLHGEVETRKQVAMEEEGRVDEMVERFSNIPSINPIRNGKINSGFGYRTHPITGSWEFHEGLDIGGDFGTPIYATAGGTVIYSDWRYGYGLSVGLDHGNGFTTFYAHNSRNLVGPGERVEKGQIIAYVGNTGSTTGTHVHYEVRYQGRLTNPVRFLSLSYRDLDRIAALKK
jgi:murein DD-endopeptidase MepM/ murein hydrolase activator NlpD